MLPFEAMFGEHLESGYNWKQFKRLKTLITKMKQKPPWKRKRFQLEAALIF